MLAFARNMAMKFVKFAVLVMQCRQVKKYATTNASVTTEPHSTDFALFLRKCMEDTNAKFATLVST